ncbi:hypothetical protein KC722_01705 [Candidatus Kaiserbacteria bacterium]|nr:hypothetical protein [Candidatus Kaiserbacteria bacterium]MCB9811840.1 hypothetical protein [Candidatus Nomurabacteria bacterium]
MEKKWNLQDIRPAGGGRKRSRPSQREMNVESAPEKRPVTEDDDGTVRLTIENGTEKKRRSFWTIIVAVLLFVVAVFGASFLLRGAEVTVYPKHREPNLNATFTAYRTPQVGELSYELMVLEADGERQVSATGEEEVTEQATGEIEIYNETANTERLIKNTRFASSDGKVFRITESVVVPGAHKNAEGELIAGTIRAEVFADEPGEEYNLAPTTFTIPGYKENGFTELYEKLYAKNTVPFTGGFNGPKFIIDDAELETAKQALHNELRDALLSRVDGEKPAGFVVFPDATTFTFESLPAVEYGDNLVTIKEKALLQIPIFGEDEFAAYIAAATIPGYEQKPVRIQDLGAITFAYASATSSTTDLGNVDQFDFKLVGKPQIVWTYDEGKLKTDLMGAPKTALTTILSGYPAIERAEAKIKPFWKRSYPDSLDQIKIVESLGE